MGCWVDGLGMGWGYLGIFGFDGKGEEGFVYIVCVIYSVYI